MGLYQFQYDDIKWWADNGRRGILAWDIGTGKTFVGAKIVKKYAEENKRVLVVAPPSLIQSWVRECDAIGQLLELAWKNENANIVVTTYDRLKHIVHHRFDLVIADEAHRIKNYDSKRSAKFRALAKATPHLLMMTGTLSNHRDATELLNYLWSLNTPYILDRIPTKITHFRDAYCYKRQVSASYSKWIVRREGAELVNDTLNKYVRFRELRKEREIPELTEETRYLDSAIDLKQKVKAMAEALDLEESQIDVNYGHPHITHALMLANGIDFETGEMTNFSKIDEVEEILSQTDEQAIVWVYWRRFGEEMKNRLGDKSVLVNGGMTDKQKMEAIDGFKFGKYQYLVASIGSIAEGHNLQHCSLSIVANQWYDVIKDLQSRGRIERNGQQNKMVQIRLVCEKSLEEDVLFVLQKKMSLREAHDYLRSAVDRKIKRWL